MTGVVTSANESSDEGRMLIIMSMLTAGHESPCCFFADGCAEICCNSVGTSINIDVGMQTRDMLFANSNINNNNRSASSKPVRILSCM